MAWVMAVEFCHHGRLHYLDPGEHRPRVGDMVLSPTEHGHEVARCVWPPTEVEWGATSLPLCGGSASEEDLARDEANRARRAEIRVVAEELIARHRLPMSVVAVDHVDRLIDTDRVAVIYFKAPHRVDFRAVLGDLARALQSRIDLRQVGSRDVAALVGGVGPCGREQCCACCHPATEPVPARLARDQEHPAAALQLSGSCGRLKCCLAYEHQEYADFATRAPRIGTTVDTVHGEGLVTGHSVPLDAVWVRTQDGLRACRLDQVRVSRDGAARWSRRPSPADVHPPDASASEPAAASSTVVPKPKPGRRPPFLRGGSSRNPRADG